MKTLLVALLLVSAAFGQRHYGGMHNRYFPGASGVGTVSSTRWMGYGDDVTFGNVDFSACAWVRPTATLIASGNGDAVNTSATNWSLSYYSAQAPHPWLFGVRSLSPFVTTTPVPVAETWHLLCGKRDSVNNLVGVSIDGGAWTTTASATPPTSAAGALYIGNYTGFSGIARQQTWTKVLSTGELTSLYNSGFGLRCQDMAGSLLTSLTHCRDMSDAANMPQRDTTGNVAMWFSGASWPAAAIGKTGVLAANGFPDGGPIQPSLTPVWFSAITSSMIQYEIEYANGRPAKHVIVSGDSLLNATGTGGSPAAYGNTVTSAGAQLAQMLGSGYHYAVTAGSGYQTDTVISNLTTVENAMCGEPWAKNIYIIEIGRNDIDAAVSAGTIEANIGTIISARKAAGCTTAILTITPCTFGGTCNGTTEALKATINTWILGGATVTGLVVPGGSQSIYTGGNTGADYVIDSGNETLLATASNTLYYLDGLHYTGEGARIVANYIYTLLATL